MNYQLLNLACGSKVSEVGNWTNVDFQSPIEGVIEMNILKEMDFPEATFDVVYSAQFIEHLTLNEGEKVLKDVARVMKPGGVIRLVTPDLEELSRTYLALLDQLKAASSVEIANRYDWVRLELFDQIVRDHSGGETLMFLAACDDATKRYIVDRIGYTATTFFAPQELPQRKLTFAHLLRKVKRIPRKLRLLAGDFFASDSMRIGRFRRSGEVHRYMHDIYSLTRLLQKAGFHTIVRVDAHNSTIQNWEKYGLDVVGGTIDGPLSLYVEAKR
ncbi:MAG: methyltransferase domain-containing protein [Sedimenticola thiotaurini]|uniref:Methyltransferase domain-containing protein n=1 Tax=Sedimenticola thiotaurini TaxID=1543721 RepID=A0A558DAN7_9GAMM|nr:MAG: methyltransferase domain-containing protein [Sedimenticola thiotaurini]